MQGNFDLPATERAIADALGPCAAWWVFDCVARKRAFVERAGAGGARACVYVPKKPTAQIVELWGRGLAERMCAAFPGEALFFHAGAVFQKQGRDESVIFLRRKGLSSARVALAFGLTQRQVNNICNAARAPAMDLAA